MSDERKLEEAAAALDDVVLTLDEVTQGERVPGAAAETLERAKNSLSEAVDAIEESVVHLDDESESVS